ncbi:hypothetical protein PENTCL1PPCAC_7316, partial [Pristionchus entomophagus]
MEINLLSVSSDSSIRLIKLISIIIITEFKYQFEEVVCEEAKVAADERSCDALWPSCPTAASAAREAKTDVDSCDSHWPGRPTAARLGSCCSCRQEVGCNDRTLRKDNSVEFVQQQQ